MTAGEMSLRRSEPWWLEALRYFARRCAYCERPGFLTRDHYVPASRGGDDGPMNIVPACRVCQTRKGSKLPKHALRRTVRDRVEHYFELVAARLDSETPRTDRNDTNNRESSPLATEQCR